MSGALTTAGRGGHDLAPGPARTAAAGADVVDLGELAQAVRRGWRGIALAALLGAAAAGAVIAWAPRRYEGAATVLLRSSQDAGGSLLGRLGVPAELAPGGLGSALKSPMETELEILASRSVLGAVSDSLGLQVRVLSPKGRPSWSLLAPHPYPGSFRKLRLTFEREGAGYRVRGRGVDGVVTSGAPLATPVGTLVLAPGALPPRFEVQLLDREDALERLGERVSVEKSGGEVARVGYAAPDSLSAAAVPNAIVAAYLQRRRTTDRGVNQHRAEFVSAQVDSVARQLTDAERALREYQERSGVIDPELVGKIDLEAASEVRAQLAANAVEAVALEQLLRQVGAGTMSPRQLAAYPSFLRSGAVNELLAQLAKLETERAELLERRTEAEPEVVALTQRASDLERQLQPLGAAYAQSLGRQRAELETQAARFEAALETLPRSAQEFARRTREVRRLSQTALALQTQLLDARLAAIGEGGEVRQIDDALTPKRAAFPRPVKTLAAGVGGGAVVGVLLVLGVAFFSPRVAGATEASRLVGAPATTMGAASPLFVAMVRRQGAFTVVPLDDASAGEQVARWLGGSAPSNGTHPPARPEPEPAAAVGTRGGLPARFGSGGGTALAPVLPPLLSDPTASEALGPGRPVVLVFGRGTSRAALVDAAAAVRVAGGEIVGCVIV